MKFTIQGMTFNTKADLKAYLSNMLQKKYQSGQALDAADEALVKELLKNHPDYFNKVKGGINRILVEQHQVQGWQKCNGFVIESRNCKNKTRFSYPKCLPLMTNPKKSDHRKDVEGAFRTAVEPFIMQEKIKAFNGASSVECPVLGIPMQFNSCAAHHRDIGYRDLFNQFVEDEQLELEDVEIECKAGLDKVKEIKDQALKQKWRNYHNANADILVVSKAGHNQLHGKQSDYYTNLCQRA